MNTQHGGLCPPQPAPETSSQRRHGRHWLRLRMAQAARTGRDYALCECCGLPEGEEPLQIDHIVPRAQGGSDDFDNLQLLCRTCNSTKSNRHATDYRVLPHFLREEGVQYIASQTLTAKAIVTAPLAAIRILALNLTFGPMSKTDFRGIVGTSRGAFNRAFRQAVDLKLLDAVPMRSLNGLKKLIGDAPESHESPVDTRTPSDIPDIPESPATHLDSHNIPESPATHLDSHNIPESPATHLDSHNIPESPATHLDSHNIPESPADTSLKGISSSEEEINPISSSSTHSTEPARAWLQAQQALALQLTSVEYDTLVAPCRFFSYEDGEFKLLVPNSVARDLLGNRLRPWLKEHLAQLLGEYVDVHLILNTAAPQGIAPDTPLETLVERADPKHTVKQLVTSGVYHNLAFKLVQDYGPDACARQLAAMEAHRRNTRIAKPGGWLVRAIQEDWPMPENIQDPPPGPPR